jgi:hypothetical protein
LEVRPWTTSTAGVSSFAARYGLARWLTSPYTQGLGANRISTVQSILISVMKVCKMNRIKHAVVVRCCFDDENLLMKYLDVSKKYFAPGISGSINKDFDVLMFVNEKNEASIRNELGVNFRSFYSIPEICDYLVQNSYNIQTRHDIDDYMSVDYIDTIQKSYSSNIDKDIFLIQAQPTKLTLDGSLAFEESMPTYTDRSNSMFLSLCQVDVKTHIFRRKHREMYAVAPKVISLPAGYVKWVVHGNNTSVINGNLIRSLPQHAA